MNVLLLVVALWALHLYSGLVQADEKPSCAQYPHLTFGILPFISTEKLIYRFAPLADYLSTHLETDVRLETAPNFEEFARRTHQEQHYDILFTAPHFFPVASQKAGYQLVASIDAPQMWAVIVVRMDSPINSIADLSNKRLATVHPLGLATLLVRQHLSNARLDPDIDLNLVATPSHDASLLSAYHGATDASALMYPPYEATNETIKSAMKIIARTRSIATMPVSVAPWVEPACRTEIEMALLGINPQSTDVLRRNNFVGFRHARAEEYEKINDLLRQ